MPVQFEITPSTRVSLQAHISNSRLKMDDYLSKSKLFRSDHIPIRQYARVLKKWIADIGLGPTIYATHSIRKTEASLIYKRTNNLQAVQLLPGHTKLESTVNCLGVGVEDALEIAEKIES